MSRDSPALGCVVNGQRAGWLVGCVLASKEILSEFLDVQVDAQNRETL